jgi:large subunit ribosomal protein L9
VCWWNKAIVRVVFSVFLCDLCALCVKDFAFRILEFLGLRNGPGSKREEEEAMQIILQEDVEKLGTRGEVVEVAAGYARNYLLPHKLALEASPANIKRLEKIRITLSKRTATEKDAAQQQAGLLNQVTVKFARKAGENDQLFGSVTSADLADALKAQGFEIDKRRIQLDEAIKIVGERPVTVKLVHGVTAEFKVIVEKEA